jgi:hypothetical protein
MNFCFFTQITSQLRVDYEPITSRLRANYESTTRQYRILLDLYILCIYPAILKNTIFYPINANRLCKIKHYIDKNQKNHAKICVYQKFVVPLPPE